MHLRHALQSLLHFFCSSYRMELAGEPDPEGCSVGDVRWSLGQDVPQIQQRWGWLLLMWRNALKLAPLYVSQPIFLIICKWKKSSHFRHACCSWLVPILPFVVLLQNCFPHDVLGNYKRCRTWKVSCNSRTLKPGTNWKMVLHIWRKGRCWERMIYHKSHIVKYSQLMIKHCKSYSFWFGASPVRTPEKWGTEVLMIHLSPLIYSPYRNSTCTSKQESVYKI